MPSPERRKATCGDESSGISRSCLAAEFQVSVRQRLNETRSAPSRDAVVLWLHRLSSGFCNFFRHNFRRIFCKLGAKTPPKARLCQCHRHPGVFSHRIVVQCNYRPARFGPASRFPHDGAGRATPSGAATARCCRWQPEGIGKPTRAVARSFARAPGRPGARDSR